MTRSELVKESAIAYLKRLNISFNEVSEPEYRKAVVLQLLNGGTTTADLWVIHYIYAVFQEKMLLFIWTTVILNLSISSHHTDISEGKYSPT